MIDGLVDEYLEAWGIDDVIRDMEPSEGDMGQEKLLLARSQHLATLQTKFTELKAKYLSEGMTESEAEMKANTDAWSALSDSQKYIINVWSALKETRAYDEYMDALRSVSADTMVFLKENMTFQQDEGGEGHGGERAHAFRP